MNKAPKIYKPFFFATVLVAAMLALLLTGTYAINAASIRLIGTQLFTATQFSDLVQTLIIVVLVTIEVPFLTCGIGYWLSSKKQHR